MSILVKITLAGEHIFQLLAQYVLLQYWPIIVTILASIEQVNTHLISIQMLDCFNFQKDNIPSSPPIEAFQLW